MTFTEIEKLLDTIKKKLVPENSNQLVEINYLRKTDFMRKL